MAGVIKGTGSFVPERVITNHHLAEMVETNDQWIRERTGVKSRHVITGETTTGMAIEAGKRALAESGIRPEEIDMILLATMSSEVVMPSGACMVQGGIGASNAVCMDINSACSGFLFAYNTAQVYIEVGMANRVLVIGAESLSKLVDWSDRGTCILFGDGAGAVVLSRDEEEPEERQLSMVMHASGEKGMALTCYQLTPSEVSEGKHFIQMNGQEVFRFAARQVPQVIEELLEQLQMCVEDIDLFILHQANKRIVEAVAKRLRSPIEKFPMNIAAYGNTSSASIPILLDELNRSGGLKRGMKVVMAGFGAGLTWGATYLEW